MKLPKADLRSHVMGIVYGVLGNWVYQSIAIVAPFLTSLLYKYKFQPPPAHSWFWIGLASGWLVVGLLGAVWLRNHTYRRYERTKKLLSKMFIADAGLNRMIVARNVTLARPDIESKITMLLMHMCDVLAYRLRPDKKGATFLTLSIDDDGDHFEVFAQVRHDDPDIAEEIAERLHVEGSLAGQALHESRCVGLPDCRRAPRHIQWTNTHDPPRFIGRAAAPVQIIPKRQSTNIGVVCLDLPVRWKLSMEDAMLMESIADKIASLWILYQPNHTQSGPPPVADNHL